MANFIAVSTEIGVWFYDADTGAEMALITGHIEGVGCIAISPDGKTLATGSNDDTIPVVGHRDTHSKGYSR